MPKRCCQWCERIVESDIPRPQHVFCCQSCVDAELLFSIMFSDEEQNRRAHYKALTKGEDFST